MWQIIGVVKKGDYLYAKVPGHPKATKHGYVLLHRVIYENHHGRILEEWEIVHHKNHNKKDNRPENLEAMSRKEHRIAHSTGRAMINITCPECGKAFVRERRQTHFSKGGKRTFCSRKCNGIFHSKDRRESPRLPRG